MTNRIGYTLLELTLVLTILGIIALIVVPAASRARDTLAVRSARSDLATAIALARSTAIVAGGAQVVIDAGAGAVSVRTLDGVTVRDTLFLRTTYGVTLESDRGARTTLRFDALGIGRIANATLRVRRGAMVASLVISAYGRVRL